MNLFLDEEGNCTEGEGGAGWIIVNTRQTIHVCHKIESTNPLIVWRMCYLKSLELKDFQWKKVTFDRKNKSIVSAACVLEKNIVPYHGVITFEEAIKDSILKFIPHNMMDFQIIFVFENGIIRCIEFQERQIVSSRLLSFLPQLKSGFIVSDKDIENTTMIRTIDFCGSETLKKHVLEMDFEKEKNVLNPPLDFPISYSSYYGKVRAKKHICAFALTGFVCLFMQFQSGSLVSQSNLAVGNIQNIENALKKDEKLAQKKSFFKEYLKKGWDKNHSILPHLNELGFIVETGFYVYDMSLSANKVNMTLKPFTENSQVLLKFQLLEKKFKNIKAKVVIHKPPYGLEKGKRKSCSKAKVEIVWGGK